MSARFVSMRTRALIVAGVLLVTTLAALVSAAAWRKRTRRISTEAALHDALAMWRRELRGIDRRMGWSPYSEPFYFDRSSDCLVRFRERPPSDPTFSHFICDAWGHPIVFRLPGVVHRSGWDIYSFGPNGIDEQGQGDDLVIGDDVATVTSGG